MAPLIEDDRNGGNLIELTNPDKPRRDSLNRQLGDFKSLVESSRPLLALLEPLKAICQGRSAIAFVRELGDQQRERLGVARNSEWAGVHRLKTDIADQLSGYLLRTRILPAIDKARSLPVPRFPPLASRPFK